MALYHVAKLTPTKAEMLAAWVPTQPWCPSPDAPVEVVGAFRFDDPAGKVGMETHLVSCDDTVLQVPLTYREAPLDDGMARLVGEMHHSALGNRWVYDGLSDDRYVTTLAGVAMTGQGEALGMVLVDGRWVIAPTHVRIQGGGWTQERVAVDGFERVDPGPEGSVEFRSDRFAMTVHRRPAVGPQPPMGLTATWDGQPDPMVLAEVSLLD